MSAYTAVAACYEPIAAATRAAIDLQIEIQLGQLDPGSDPILDIGAGTGRSTRLIAATLPRAEVFAVEPDDAMRAALMVRLCDDPVLRNRVSVLPFPVLEAPLPDRLGGVLASASLVHFDANQRQQLWALLAERVTQGGRILVEVQCPEAVEVPRQRVATVRVGRIEYVAYAAATRSAPDVQRWTMTYESFLGESLFETRCAEFLCHTVSAATLVEEGRRAGLEGEVSADLVVFRTARR